MTLKTKWIDILYNVATGSRKVRNFFTPVGALFYGLLVYFFIVLALQVDRLLDITDILPETFPIILAVPAFSLALLLVGWWFYILLRQRGLRFRSILRPD